MRESEEGGGGGRGVRCGLEKVGSKAGQGRRELNVWMTFFSRFNMHCTLS